MSLEVKIAFYAALSIVSLVVVGRMLRWVILVAADEAAMQWLRHRGLIEVSSEAESKLKPEVILPVGRKGAEVKPIKDIPNIQQRRREGVALKKSA